jgi:hypothetical protein
MHFIILKRFATETQSKFKGKKRGGKAKGIEELPYCFFWLYPKKIGFSVLLFL